MTKHAQRVENDVTQTKMEDDGFVEDFWKNPSNEGDIDNHCHPLENDETDVGGRGGREACNEEYDAFPPIETMLRPSPSLDQIFIREEEEGEGEEEEEEEIVFRDLDSSLNSLSSANNRQPVFDPSHLMEDMLEEKSEIVDPATPQVGEASASPPPQQQQQKVAPVVVRDSSDASLRTSTVFRRSTIKDHNHKSFDPKKHSSQERHSTATTLPMARGPCRSCLH